MFCCPRNGGRDRWGRWRRDSGRGGKPPSPIAAARPAAVPYSGMIRTAPFAALVVIAA